MNTSTATSVPSGTSADTRGLTAATAAFLIWGLLPLYLKLLANLPALQVTSHRLIWGCLFAMAWLAVRGQLGQVGAALANPAVRWRLCASAALISVNWVVYVWGVSNNHVIETSLGYFINPLVNVLLGVLVLSERLNRAQWTAVCIAAAGVIYLTWSVGHPPWISLAVALSFGLYGLTRKLVNVEALAGLAAETLLLLPVGLGYLVWLATSTPAGGDIGAGTYALLVLGGPLTAIPLVLFAYGARRIPYSTLGVLQYMAPTMQLLLGVFVYHESFTGPRAVGFALIWTALIIYAADGLWRSRKLAQLRA